MLNDLRAAAGFLTRLPVGRDDDETFPPTATPWLTATGAAIGATTAATAILLHAVGLPPWAAAATAAAATATLTGAMHEDGFADVCDGLGVAGDAAARREAMRRGGIGVYATTGLILGLSIKIAVVAAALDAPGGSGFVFGALIAAGALSRWTMLWPLRFMPTAADSRSAAWFGSPSPPYFAVAGVAAAAIVALCAVMASPAAMIVGAVGALAIGAVCMAILRRRFDAVGGDMAGMCQFCCEIGFLAAALAAA